MTETKGTLVIKGQRTNLDSIHIGSAGTSVITPVGAWYGTNDRSTIFVYSEDAGQWIAFIVDK